MGGATAEAAGALRLLWKALRRLLAVNPAGSV